MHAQSEKDHAFHEKAARGGAWVEFEFDVNNALFVRVDRKKKFPATSFLRACGVGSDAQILQIFFRTEDVAVSADNTDNLLRRICAEDVVDKSTGELHVYGSGPLQYAEYRAWLDDQPRT